MLDNVITIAKEAGQKILEVYNAPDSIEVLQKGDKSPLTTADLVAHKHICAELARLFPEIPILSEESAHEFPYEKRSDWETFWLVDPLDGTKEFIKRNGEFTVNIALISKGAPILGVVYAPVLDWVYFAEKGHRAFKQEGQSDPVSLPSQQPEAGKTKVVASRSHVSPETQGFIDALSTSGNAIELVSMGSSLKLCLVAEGVADVYPRLAPTMEWDTGAAHAVVSEAGKTVTQADSGADVVYGKEDLLNPYFVVR